MTRQILTFAIALLFCCTTMQAQQHHGAYKHQPKPIEEIVSNLTDQQKQSIDDISNKSRKRIDALRHDLKSVRDSVGMFLRADGDNSRKLYPLFDREARLQAAISKEVYATKVKIDKVLTKEQRQQLHDIHNHGKKEKKK